MRGGIVGEGNDQAGVEVGGGSEATSRATPTHSDTVHRARAQGPAVPGGGEKAQASNGAEGTRPRTVQVESLCFTKCAGPLGTWTRPRPHGSRTFKNFAHASRPPD